MLPAPPPLGTDRANFSAISSSLSNARFGGRGITILVISYVDLRMQLLMTRWVHQDQIGNRIIPAIYYPYLMVEMPTGFTSDLLAALRAYTILVEPQLEEFIVSFVRVSHLKS